MATSRCRRKRCRFCGKLFLPDPRLKTRQSACSAPECQRARRKENQESWLERHPGYFDGRYFNTKDWRRAHPDYQRRWRREHPEAHARDNDRRQKARQLAHDVRAEIQNSILIQRPINKAVASSLLEPAAAEIQNSISSQVLTLSIFSALYAARLPRRDTRLDRPGPAHGLPSPTQLRGASPQGSAIAECLRCSHEEPPVPEDAAGLAANPSVADLGLQLD
jgi:hypothetical protein